MLHFRFTIGFGRKWKKRFRSITNCKKWLSKLYFFKEYFSEYFELNLCSPLDLHDLWVISIFRGLLQSMEEFLLLLFWFLYNFLTIENEMINEKNYNNRVIIETHTKDWNRYMPLVFCFHGSKSGKDQALDPEENCTISFLLTKLEWFWFCFCLLLLCLTNWYVSTFWLKTGIFLLGIFSTLKITILDHLCFLFPYGKKNFVQINWIFMNEYLVSGGCSFQKESSRSSTHLLLMICCLNNSI